jgi:helicase
MMVIIHDNGLMKFSARKKRKTTKIFQKEFRTDSIPLPRRLINQLVKEVEYPYPPQVIAIGMMFPVPIPASIANKYEHLIDSRRGDKVFLKQYRNVMVCSPTSSGKTFSAILFILKHLKPGKVGMYSVPLKALGEEKHRQFSKQFPSLKIGLMTGDYHSVRTSQIGRYDIIIIVYEKLDSMLRNDIKTARDAISAVVIDEIHVMKTDRGKIIEPMIMRLKEIDNIPIMASSATVSNSDDISSWLNAGLLVSDFRPVPLKIGVLHDGNLEYEDGSFEEAGKTVEDTITNLVKKGEQIMYVRATRKQASAFAKKMVSKMKGKFYDSSLSIPVKKTEPQLELNSRCIKYGVAWHHAGLVQENRTYIEESFKDGNIRLIVATTTLSAGINIPARYVFVDFKRWSGWGMEPLPVMEIFQILGRAGRVGYDEEGTGILVCRNEDNYYYCTDTYFNGIPEPIESPLLGKEILFHSIIGDIGSEHGNRESDIIKFYEKNSFAARQDKKKLITNLRKTLYKFRYFQEPLVESLDDDGSLELTGMGKIVKRYYVDPVDAEIIIEMIRNCKSLNSISIVHAIMRCKSVFPVNPRGSTETWDQLIYSSRGKLYYDSVDLSDLVELKALKTAIVLVGTGESDEVIYADESVKSDVFFGKYGISLGDMQRLTGSGGKLFWLAAFAASVAGYYKKKKIKNLINELYYRLKYGISKKLVPICRIKYVGRERGKILFSSGYQDVLKIARARTADIAKLMIGKKRLGTDTANTIIDEAVKLHVKKKKEATERSGKKS